MKLTASRKFVRPGKTPIATPITSPVTSPITNSITALAAALIAASLLAWGCGGGGTGNSMPIGGQSSTAANVQPITVGPGPAAAVYGADYSYINGPFTSVTVCSHGSTTNCQTIGGILVDTGSPGLRLLSSALTISLPAQTGAGGNPIGECTAFQDGVTWGAVETADVKIGGETANSMPIQVIGAASLPTIPSDCSSQGVPMDTLADLLANGFLGVGNAVYDCGANCTQSGTPSQSWYYSCTTAGCTDTTEALNLQVQNPVASFATDNNGVVIQLPAVTGATSSVTGSLIFGIGTQSNNGLGSATVYGTDAIGDFITTYNSTQYPSFTDSGSNALYFLDTTATGIPTCTDLTFLYCPVSPATVSVVNHAETGTNGAAANFSFIVGNGDVLTSNINNTAINNLDGPYTGFFDYGLPFFYGRTVFTAIGGKSTPGGNGPYIAF